MTGEQDEMRRALRFAADMICLWCLCDRAECRRARACQGDVRLCGGRVADWLETIDTRRAAEPGFFEIEMRLEAKEAFRAYRVWREALARVLRGERPDMRSIAHEREDLLRRVVALQRSMAGERQGRVRRRRKRQERGRG